MADWLDVLGELFDDDPARRYVARLLWLCLVGLVCEAVIIAATAAGGL